MVATTVTPRPLFRTDLQHNASNVSLRCCLFNARSIVNKLSELHQILYVDNYDTVFVTETWLHEEICNGMLDPSLRYNIVRRDREHHRGGGVCALVSKRWDIVPVSIGRQFSDIEIVCFDCLVLKSRIRFFVVYRPPSYDHTANSYMRRVIDCLATYESPRYTNIIVGDLNLPNINWTTLTCPSDNFHRPFLSFLIESSYIQLIDFPTCGNNILDLVLTNNANTISSITSDVPCGASDHMMIIFQVIIANDSHHNVVTDPCYTHNWDLADYDAIALYLSGVNWHNLVTVFPSAPALWDTFMCILYAAVELYVPKRRVFAPDNSRKYKTKPPHEMRKCLTKKRLLWRQLRQNKHDTVARNKYDECVRHWRHLVQQRQMRAEERLIECNNIGSFYKFVNRRLSNRIGIGPIVTHDNVTLTNDYDKACSLNNYFTSVGRPDNGFVPPCSSCTSACLDTVYVNELNVLAAIKKLKSNYACGPDGIPPVFFKRLQYTIAQPLAIVFSQLLSVAYVPDVWKTAVITPVHKKGPLTDCSNYRPISLTCVTSKLLERIVASQIREHLVSNNLLHHAQHGFTIGRSTCTNLLECLNDWTLHLQDKHQVVVAYIDFSKAFDVVSHNKLFERLQSYGISGTLLSWLRNFFTGRTQCTKVGTMLSDLTDLISGVIQGSVLGPLMFLAYLNELAEILEKFGITVKFFADDVKLYVKIKNDVDVCVLQEAVDALCRWAEVWQLSISIDKCSVLNIGKCVPSTTISIDGALLPYVTSCRDLGITVTSDLTPSVHVNNIIVKAHQRANAIHRCFISRNVELLVRAYLVYVRPLLEYNSPVWSPYLMYDIQAIEHVQRRFTKRLPGFGTYSYGERLQLLQLSSLELRRLRIDLVWCYKIVFGLVNLHTSDFF